ncbi:uncharacterized protein LOC105841781 [Bombyx mori]|uniref:Peptidase S1 domain-containing protein n=1 Tax=Bombyx mori TaxID=7091 RepID=A0A8R2RB95_BOMMO|nr:uncharacterized protein LOC105841781 [Bombyx mori]
MKKKVILTCVPKSYELDYLKIIKWSWIDIAIVKVESEYDFNDEKYTQLCSYKPAIIDVNYARKYQEPGTDALVLGWGHKEKWRKPEDVSNYNQDTLNYAPIMLQNKEKCTEAYKDIERMNILIDNYMICADGKGNINAKGEQILKGKPEADGCATNPENLKGILDDSCEKPFQNKDPSIVLLNARKNNSDDNISQLDTRRNDDGATGICQNDHGGPLVTWVGTHEVLIGVASVFRVDSNSQCTGPYLFTSTECNGAFIGCILNQTVARRTGVCDQSPIERGFDIIEKSISWKGHPEGPAQNELLKMRPQVPITHFG